MKTLNEKYDSSLEIKGIVEGFYGPPYRWPDRFFIIPFFKEYGFNYYLYGPKEDPYHRQYWAKLYPKSEIDNFSRFFLKCSALGIKFNYALTPGDKVDKAVKKLTQLRDVGITEFGLFFDDLEVEIEPNLAKRQAELANIIYDKFRPDRLLLCPSQYCGRRSQYLSVLAQELNKRILILWTGPQVVAKTIEKKDLDWMINLFGRRIVIWDNYPVNDFDPVRLFLGPFRGRSPDLLNRIVGYLANPMNQPRISLIPLYTLAEFFRRKEKYKPNFAIKDAMKRFNLEKNYTMLRQFFPSRIYPRKSYETRLLSFKKWSQLLPIIEKWQRFDFSEGQAAVDNLILIRDLLIKKITSKEIDRNLISKIKISKQKTNYYFENAAVDLLLTKKKRSL